MKKFTSILVLVLSVAFASAQKQATKWYFGYNAAIDFLSGTPVEFSGSAMNMLEGVASIADTAGNTLFYTNGANVWNANNSQMPNGYGLLGDNNSAQAVIIVPDPGNANQYYVVTTPTWGTGSMYYSIVDMTLQGGLGDVTDKNVFLFNNSTEKVTAVRHSNGTDIWIVGHEWLTNNFYSFLITAAGVNLTPVITPVGSVHSGTLGFAGYMKASHHGNKIAYAITISLNIVELLDFDNATGIPSNPILMNNVPEAYGLEFSPDDSRLYVTSENPQIIYQWDLNAGSPAAIIASQTDIGPDVGGDAFAALQLAPDGKIYLANRFSQYLGVINDPNALGTACDFVDNAIYLFSGSSEYGLPNFFQSYFDTTELPPVSQTNFNAADTLLCQKFCMDFFDQSTNNPTGWNWSFPGGSPVSSTLQNPTQICYNLPGSYDVTLITTSTSGNDTLTLYNYITVYPTPPFPIIVQTDYTLTSSPASSYQWQFNSTDIPGATNQSYTVLQSGYYTIVVTDSNNCSNSFTQYVLISGMDDITSEAAVSVYPNPTTGNFTIELLNEVNASELSIDVINTLGQKVYSSLESQFNATSDDGYRGFNSKKKEIDLNMVARGIYFIEIKTVKDGLPGIGMRKKIMIVN